MQQRCLRLMSPRRCRRGPPGRIPSCRVMRLHGHIFTRLCPDAAMRLSRADPLTMLQYLRMRERPPSPSPEPVLDWSVEKRLERGLLFELDEEMCESAGLPVIVRLSAAVAERLIPTLDEEEQGADEELWTFDMLCVARQAIEHAAPWQDRVPFSLRLGQRELALCVLIDTTHGRALHLVTAEAGRR